MSIQPYGFEPLPPSTRVILTPSETLHYDQEYIGELGGEEKKIFLGL